MIFIPANLPTLFAFYAILLVIVSAILAACYCAARREHNSSIALHWSVRLLILLALWLAAVAFLVRSGLIQEQPLPFLPLFAGVSLGLGVALAFSPLGRVMSHQLTFRWLIAFQVFRLALEVVLHNWVRQGVIPETMTWSGGNLDIITGIAALLLLPFASPNRRLLLWAFNLLGLALLVNVGRIAILSSPLPFAWNVQPPLQLAFHLPYAYIIPICVAGALTGHLVLTRKLLLPAADVFPKERA